MTGRKDGGGAALLGHDQCVGTHAASDWPRCAYRYGPGLVLLSAVPWVTAPLRPDTTPARSSSPPQDGLGWRPHGGSTLFRD